MHYHNHPHPLLLLTNFHRVLVVSPGVTLLHQTDQAPQVLQFKVVSFACFQVCLSHYSEPGLQPRHCFTAWLKAARDPLLIVVVRVVGARLQPVVAIKPQNRNQ